MAPALERIVLSFLLVFWETASGHVLPPRNLSIRWINDFKPELSWEPPTHPMTNCTYTLMYRGQSEDSEESIEKLENQKQILNNFQMGGGFLQWSVRTSCDSGESEAAVMSVTYPELVKDLQCYGYTATLTKCSWVPASDAPDVGFFWTDVPDSPPVYKCLPSVQSPTRSCDVHISNDKEFNILINGTLNNSVVRNTFFGDPVSAVRPPPLNWTVTKMNEKLEISWTPPSILSLIQWNFIITVKGCGETKKFEVQEQTSYLLDVKHPCVYCMTISADSLEGSSPVSKEKCFNSDVGNHGLLYAAITIPILMACMTTLTFVCCRKNKDKIFLKVPEPRDLITDTLDNNNKNSFNNLYVPVNEEQSCKITLVIDKQDGKPYC
ncbi:hypothetical protein FQA47_008440 [Oryzias melastigma]|uniref:Uncharacterized LOC112156453 n=1 Tax=Oryzias melastigma TaxID=30732 RepID=A0A3B3D4Y3_ORYME|nr:interleukin-13 receptor subunit alpha-1 [Oryzias melastigma]KAF6730819.1 hypothetical protein FQA47_008440 [Oryzias melastigma]